MKKCVLLLLLFTISFISYSQECSLLINKTDEFTKEISQRTDSEVLFGSQSLQRVIRVQAIRKGDKIILNLFLVDYFPFEVKEGASLLFLAENGEVAKLTSMENKKSKKSSGYSTAGIDYLVDELAFNLLKNNDFHKLRIETIETEMPATLEKESVGILARLFTCIQ